MGECEPSREILTSRSELNAFVMSLSPKVVSSQSQVKNAR